MDNRHINAESPTGGVLEPIAVNEFFANYWEQQPLHVARKSTNPFEKLISAEAIEALLSTNELFFPAVQLSHSGHSIPISEYVDDNNKIVSSRIIDRYRRGSTIVLSHAHKLQSELMQLCRCIQSSFMMRCQTNVYLSPAGNQGFNPHFDTHDVFILQVSGKKTFNFYSGGAEFPTRADRFDSEIHTVGSKTEQIELSAGDTLYIPRGFIHDAVADQFQPSLHVTLGVHPIQTHELVQEILQMRVESDAGMRRAIPQQVWMSSESPTDMVQNIKNMMLEHINVETMELAMSRLRDDLAVETTQNAHASLSRSVEPQLSLSSEVQVCHSMILQVERAAAGVKVRTFGTVAEFKDPIGTAVEWLLSQSYARVQDFPNLDNSQRLALATRLLESRLISVR